MLVTAVFRCKQRSCIGNRHAGEQQQRRRQNRMIHDQPYDHPEDQRQRNLPEQNIQIQPHISQHISALHAVEVCADDEHRKRGGESAECIAGIRQQRGHPETEHKNQHADRRTEHSRRQQQLFPWNRPQLVGCSGIFISTRTAHQHNTKGIHKDIEDTVQNCCIKQSLRPEHS